MFDKIFDRRNFVVILVVMLFIILLLGLADITIVKGEYYRERADNSFLKSVTLSAKRGEIFDANGVLLAGNIPSYTVKFLDAPQYADQINKVCIELLTLLDEFDEEYLEFPIKIIDGEFYFTNDLQTEEWLARNEFALDMTASDVYEEVRKRELIDEQLDNYDAQKLMLYKGIRLPISVRKMQFLYEMKKNSFLEGYELDLDITAEEAFVEIRDKKRFAIADKYSDEEYTNEEALKILTIRHASNLQGYLGYVPIDVATNISKESAVTIQELGMDFPGVTIEIDPIRNYPFDDSAAHIIGYMGKIATQSEIEKYNRSTGYSNDNLIGKTGLEDEFEDILHGIDGNKYIYADAKGNYIGDMVEGIEGKEVKESKSGKNITLTIDIELQKAVERYLKYTLDELQTGGSYNSEWGNQKFDKTPNAQTGAAVVVNVKTGEVLAMANYPSYDLNLFSTGITFDDWNSLQPENPRNPLAPRPLYNIATSTAVQPGSVYKPITVLAALEQGLKATDRLYTDGVVELGKQLMRCWYYRAPYHGKHGSITALQALEVSCNYFMFDIVRGYDYYREKKLDFEMNTEILLDYTKRVGLGTKTGIEVFEVNMGIPDIETKKNIKKYSLRRALNSHLEDYFPASIVDDEDKKNDLIDIIVSWADDYVDADGNKTSRGEIIRRLMTLGPKTDFAETAVLADLIKYSYFEQIAWREGDDLNLSIGQGDHRYTVIQMARYMATIANGGYLNDLTLIKEVDGKPVEREAAIEPNFNDLENLASVREGMRLVAHGSRGSAKYIFRDFEIEVGAKTGTAQKAGRIPPLDEAEYIRVNLEAIIDIANKGLRESNSQYIKITSRELEEETSKLLEDRNAEIGALTLKLKELDDEDLEGKAELSSKIQIKASGNYLERGSVMRAVLLELGRDRITNEMIDSFREEYEPFAWFVSFAPFDDPEIAVVVLIPQGAHGYYAAPMVRDIYAKYFGYFDHSEMLTD